mgnify:CR=1 FL=1
MNTFYFGIFTVSGVGQRALVIDPGNSSVLVDEPVSITDSSAKTTKYAELTAQYGSSVIISREQEAFSSIDLVDNLPISTILMVGYLNTDGTYTQSCTLAKRNGDADTILASYSYDATRSGAVPTASTPWADSESAFVLCYDANGAAQIVTLLVDGTNSLGTLPATTDNYAGAFGHHVVLSDTGERLLFVADSSATPYTGRLLRNTAGVWAAIGTGEVDYPVSMAQLRAIASSSGVTPVSIVGRTAIEGDGTSINEFYDTARAYKQMTPGGYVVQNVASAVTTDLSTTITERTGGTTLAGGPAFLYLDADIPAVLGFWRNLVGVVETEIP